MAIQSNLQQKVEIIISKINLMFENEKIGLIVVRHDGDNHILKNKEICDNGYTKIIPDFIFERMALSGYAILTGKELYSVMETMHNQMEFHSDTYKFFIPNGKLNVLQAIDFNMDIELFNSDGVSHKHTFKGYHAKMLFIIFKMLFDKYSHQGNFKNSMFQRTVEILFDIFNRRNGFKSQYIDSYFGNRGMAFHIAQELNLFLESCGKIQKSRFFLNGDEYNSVDWWDYDD